MRNLEGTGIPFIVYSAIALSIFWVVGKSIEDKFDEHWNQAIYEMEWCVEKYKKSINTCYRQLRR